VPPVEEQAWDDTAMPRHFYCEGKYDSLGRFVSYWHQIHEIRRREPTRVLEIGVGNGFVSRYLRERGYHVMTLDINPRLQPDVLGSLTAMPFADNSFDVVSACEVLEHVPQASVLDALREMRRVTRETAVVSVPNLRRAYGLQILIPKMGLGHWLFERSAPRGYTLPPAHQWEIGHASTSAQHVREWVREAGFRLEHDYRPLAHPYHHFFVLRAR
jgi:ubiquinone/menaquinone biosynthesis C-methylase UbiE